MESEVPDRCDVVVIGAGMSGLVAGALLSKAGLDVTVVDAEVRPGGYLAGFQRRRFNFDTAIHWLNQCGPGGTVHRILSYIGDDFPRCEPLSNIRRYKGDSFDWLLTSDPDQLKQSWLESYPEERAGIERFFRDARVMGDRMEKLTRFMLNPQSMKPLAKAAFGLRSAWWGLPFLRNYALPTDVGMRRYFKSDAIQKIFATEEMLISVLVQIGWAYQGDFQAPPEGGSVEFARWLVGRIEAAGSRVVLGRRVARVLVESGGVRGVALEAPRKRADRREHEIACRHVVASCDVLSLYEKLLPPGTADPKHLDRLRRMDLYNSSVTLSLGIDCPVEELGFGEEMWIVTRDDVPRAEQNCADPERCAITILAPSFRDPSMAPPGKGTLTLYTEAQIGYGNRWQTGPGYERGPDYRAFKEAYAQTILGRVEKSLGIELRRHIEEMAVATPITHWRYTGNHSGSIMGERPSRWNIRNGVARYRTPVDRLFLGGQWAEYGGGVPIATRAGANASVLVMRETRPEACEALCAAMLPG